MLKKKKPISKSISGEKGEVALRFESAGDLWIEFSKEIA